VNNACGEIDNDNDHDTIVMAITLAILMNVRA